MSVLCSWLWRCQCIRLSMNMTYVWLTLWFESYVWLWPMHIWLTYDYAPWLMTLLCYDWVHITYIYVLGYDCDLVTIMTWLWLWQRRLWSMHMLSTLCAYKCEALHTTTFPACVPASLIRQVMVTSNCEGSVNLMATNTGWLNRFCLLGEIDLAVNFSYLNDEQVVDVAVQAPQPRH